MPNSLFIEQFIIDDYEEEFFLYEDDDCYQYEEYGEYHWHIEDTIIQNIYD